MATIKVDDIDGSPAERSVTITVDGRRVTVDLSKKNFERLIAPLLKGGQRAGTTQRAARAGGRKRAAAPSGRGRRPATTTARAAGAAGRRRTATRAAGRKAAGRRGGRTLLSRLSPDERTRFKAWANMPNARRVADAKVQAWIDAGKP